MPYTIGNPPKEISDLPPAAQKTWINAFNSAYNSGSPEGDAFAIAWSAVHRKYKKVDGKWVRKKTAEEIEQEATAIFRELVGQRGGQVAPDFTWFNRIDSDMEDLLATKMVQYYDNKYLQIGDHIIGNAYRNGEEAGAEELELQTAQYSAILDEAVCPFCEALDGLTIDLQDEDGVTLYDKYSPDQHPQCRCLWIFQGKGIKRYKRDNKDFEEKFTNKFNGILKGKGEIETNMNLPQILDSGYGKANMNSRWYVWMDDPKVSKYFASEQSTKEALNKANTKFARRINIDIANLQDWEWDEEDFPF